MQRKVVDHDTNGHRRVRLSHLPERSQQQQLEDRRRESTPRNDAALRVQRLPCNAVKLHVPGRVIERKQQFQLPHRKAPRRHIHVTVTVAMHQNVVLVRPGDGTCRLFSVHTQVDSSSQMWFRSPVFPRKRSVRQDDISYAVEAHVAVHMAALGFGIHKTLVADLIRVSLCKIHELVQCDTWYQWVSLCSWAAGVRSRFSSF